MKQSTLILPLKFNLSKYQLIRLSIYSQNYVTFTHVIKIIFLAVVADIV